MADFEIFIKIVLYLLLALAFFSDYLKGTAILMFIFGIIAILCLTFAKINKWEEEKLGYLFIAPFILFFLFVLTKLFYREMFSKGWDEGNLIGNLREMISNLITWDSMWAILIIMIIIALLILISKTIKVRIIFKDKLKR